MRAIVLAAGTGSRLGEITKARTKGMVPVAGTRMIDYLLDFFQPDFFDEILIVGGFHFEDLRDRVLERKDERIRVLENKDFLKGNIYTLIRGLKEFQDDSFLITNVDHIYPPKMFLAMKETFSGIKAMCDNDRSLGADDMKVKLVEETKQISGISKKLDDFDCGYIGMTFVHQDMNKLYRETIDKTIERFGEKAVVENILQVLAEDKDTAPEIADLSGFGWFEVDDPEDLRKAEEGLKKRPDFSSF